MSKEHELSELESVERAEAEAEADAAADLKAEAVAETGISPRREEKEEEEACKRQINEETDFDIDKKIQETLDSQNDVAQMLVSGTKIDENDFLRKIKVLANQIQTLKCIDNNVAEKMRAEIAQTLQAAQGVWRRARSVVTQSAPLKHLKREQAIQELLAAKKRSEGLAASIADAEDAAKDKRELDSTKGTSAAKLPEDITVADLAERVWISEIEESVAAAVESVGVIEVSFDEREFLTLLDDLKADSNISQVKKEELSSFYITQMMSHALPTQNRLVFLDRRIKEIRAGKFLNPELSKKTLEAVIHKTLIDLRLFLATQSDTLQHSSEDSVLVLYLASIVKTSGLDKGLLMICYQCEAEQLLALADTSIRMGQLNEMTYRVHEFLAKIGRIKKAHSNPVITGPSCRALVLGCDAVIHNHPQDLRKFRAVYKNAYEALLTLQKHFKSDPLGEIGKFLEKVAHKELGRGAAYSAANLAILDQRFPFFGRLYQDLQIVQEKCEALPMPLKAEITKAARGLKVDEPTAVVPPPPRAAPPSHSFLGDMKARAKALSRSTPIVPSLQ